MNRVEEVILAAKPHDIQARIGANYGESESTTSRQPGPVPSAVRTVNHCLDGGLKGVASYNVRFAPKVRTIHKFIE
jgi:4-hydroxy-3-methylbut-2-en-1-yl diphosphate synthase IspG/GcpE